MFVEAAIGSGKFVHQYLSFLRYARFSSSLTLGFFRFTARANPRLSLAVHETFHSSTRPTYKTSLVRRRFLFFPEPVPMGCH
jgi:hypothetical protein